jgi:hypothetical protein
VNDWLAVPRDWLDSLGEIARFGSRLGAVVLSGRVLRFFGESLRQAGILIFGSAIVIWGLVFVLGLQCGIQGAYLLRADGAPAYAGVFSAWCDLRELLPYAFGYMLKRVKSLIWGRPSPRSRTPTSWLRQNAIGSPPGMPSLVEPPLRPGRRPSGGSSPRDLEQVCSDPAHFVSDGAGPASERAEECGRAMLVTTAAAGAFGAAPAWEALQRPPTLDDGRPTMMALSILRTEVELMVDAPREVAADTIGGDPDLPSRVVVYRPAVAIAAKVMRTVCACGYRPQAKHDSKAKTQQRLSHGGSVTAAPKSSCSLCCN